LERSKQEIHAVFSYLLFLPTMSVLSFTAGLIWLRAEQFFKTAWNHTSSVMKLSIDN